MVPDPRYRCLIPLTEFAQPEGPRGRMTRTWFRVRDCAGLRLGRVLPAH